MPQALQPAFMPAAPAPAQPQFYGYPYFMQAPFPAQAPAPAPAANYATVGVPFGVGLTGQEALARNIATAHENKVYERQSIAPADTDPLREYWVREMDGSWTLRNRLTIESGDIGDWTWYINPNDQTFYAVLREKVKED